MYRLVNHSNAVHWIDRSVCVADIIPCLRTANEVAKGNPCVPCVPGGQKLSNEPSERFIKSAVEGMSKNISHGF